MDNIIKNKIIEQGILSKDDYENAPEWARNFAAVLVEVSENEILCSDFVSKFEVEKFLEELSACQDKADLKNCDKVSDNFEEKTRSVRIGIPNKLIPYLRQVALPNIDKNLED